MAYGDKCRDLYFIYMPERYDAGDHLFKIGSTKNVHKKLTMLQAGSPYELKLYAFRYTKKYKAIKKFLEMEGEKKRDGWYYFTKDDVDRIIDWISRLSLESLHIKFPDNVEEWFKEGWKASPDVSKERWCSDTQVEEIKNHMSTLDLSNVSADEIASKEADYFYETFCKDTDFMNELNNAWKVERELFK